MEKKSVDTQARPDSKSSRYVLHQQKAVISQLKYLAKFLP